MLNHVLVLNGLVLLPFQDFTRIYSTLGLGKGLCDITINLNPCRSLRKFTVCSNVETISALQVFRKRHADAVRVNYVQATQPTTIDFAHYRSVLKNQAIVDEVEKLLKGFKPVTYDVNAHIKAIETFEAKAVRPFVSSNDHGGRVRVF